MDSEASHEYMEDPTSPISEERLHTTSHSTKTGPSCGTRCVVCSDVAPPNTVFRRHYGVICCEACKCFFRRTVQMGRDYKCRFGNNCPVGRNTVNMKQVCQACRFQTCTRAGMKIESVKKFPRKIKEDMDYSKSSSNGPATVITTRRYKEKAPKMPAKVVIKRETGDPVSLSEPKKAQPGLTTSSLSTKSIESKLSDGDFDYESEFEQFKFNISSPDLSLYHSALDAAIPKLFSGESLENIHEKSSIPTPESVSGESAEKTLSSSPLEKSKGSSPVRSVSLTKQPSPLVLTRVTGSTRTSHGGIDTADGILPEVSSLLSRDQKQPDDTMPSIQLLQSGEEKTGRELASIMEESSRQAKKREGSSEIDKWQDMLAKKIRLEEALSHITARQAQVKANLLRLSTGYNNSTVPAHSSSNIRQLNIGSLSHPATPNVMIPQNKDASIVGQPVYSTHETPLGTPAPSPLPSPHVPHSIPPPVLTQTPSHPNSPHPLSNHNLSQPGTPINVSSLPTSPMYSNQQTPNSHYGSNNQMYFPNSSQGNVFFNPQVSVPLYPPHSLVPALVHLPHPAQGFSHSPNPSTSQLSSPGMAPHQHSSLTCFRFPSAVPPLGSSPLKGEGSELPSPSFTHDSEGKLSVELPEGSEHDYRDITITPRGSISASAPASACPSPIPRPSRTLASDAPEAEVDEVLGSLKLRIRSLFKWARSEVEDFEDLSPLDQKALLRRTVSELVMLGFARVSIPYDGMLLLGSTGKVIRNTNRNPGVAAVAMVTLSKLVVPLKVLNIDDRELSLMQEIVLFNPESNGLCNRETVRQYRKRKHIELMEYSEKNEPGRFGELMCLLTPLYEVSLEVTEQLRLEQFVHEGEARIDALLLMSMINQGGGTMDEPIEDVTGN